MGNTANLYYYYYYYSDTHLNEGIRVDGPKESRGLTYTTNVALLLLLMTFFLFL